MDKLDKKQAKDTHMEQRFNSKVVWWFYLVIFIVAVILVKPLSTGYWIGAGVCGLILLLLVHMLFNTYYIITEDGHLVAHSSVFPKKQIDIKELTAVEETSIPMSSYALSLDRLMLWKLDKMYFMVSPKDKKAFYNALKKHNPSIRLKVSS